MAASKPTNLKHFKSGAAFRNWLERNGESAAELWIAFYKKSSDKGGMTYPESLDEALAYGWIDGIRKSVDDERFAQRFTPRRPGSIWSAVNIDKVRKLTEADRMAARGTKVFNERDPSKSDKYSFEQGDLKLDPPLEKAFRANKSAWTFFQSQPQGYRKLATWWIVSAKKDETRAKRLAQLIDLCENEQRLPMISSAKKK